MAASKVGVHDGNGASIPLETYENTASSRSALPTRGTCDGNARRPDEWRPNTMCSGWVLAWTRSNAAAAAAAAASCIPKFGKPKALSRRLGLSYTTLLSAKLAPGTAGSLLLLLLPACE